MKEGVEGEPEGLEATPEDFLSSIFSQSPDFGIQN